jgi:Fe-S cluster biogenesis protein NfuA
MEDTVKTKTPILIYAESTPNPATIKFVANFLLLPEKSVEYKNIESTEGCPLANALFSNFEYVAGVYIKNNFVTITKKEFFNWSVIIPELRNFLKEYIESGNDILTFLPPEDHIDTSANILLNQPLGDIEQKIIDTIDEYVKPAVETDGGEISFKGFNDGVVTVVMKGSCSGCPSSTVTLKNGIENLLKQMVPGVTEVVAEQE